MELRHLRYFAKVAEELHFGRAAAALGMSQPPLSQQIRALEVELGVVLFARTSRRVELTEAGRRFLEEARRLLAQAERAVGVARRAHGGELGELSLGFVTSVPFVPVVSEALFAFRRACPDVRLHLSEMARAAQIAALAGGEIDVAFMRGAAPPALPSALVAAPIHEEPLIVAMRRDHPLAATARRPRVADLRGEPLVLYDRERGAGCVEQVEDLCRAAGFRAEVAQEVQGASTLLGLVAAGFGISVIPASLGRLHVETLCYKVLDDARATSRLWLAHHAEPSALSGRFTAIVHDAVTGRDLVADAA